MKQNQAYVFPGQGSQCVGMLSELSQKYPQIAQTFQIVSDRLGYDVWNLTQEGPEQRLNQTEFTQVAMLTADVAVYNVWQSFYSTKPLVMAGHSLGEYAALVCAGALSLENAAWLVSQRGKIMQAHVPAGNGAMAAIVGLTDAQVEAICHEASDALSQVSPANFNAIGQVVIAGHTLAVERAIVLADNQQARLAKIIPVSVPCHCALLKEAAHEFADCLAQVAFQMPAVSVISNVTAVPYTDVASIRSLLQSQLYEPVRWVETIQWMANAGIAEILELGPGKVLTGLIKRIDKTLSVMAIHDQNTLQQALSHDGRSE